MCESKVSNIPMRTTSLSRYWYRWHSAGSINCRAARMLLSVAMKGMIVEARTLEKTVVMAPLLVSGVPW